MIELQNYIKQYIKESITKEGTFPRLMNMMRGGIDTVNTIGILTAENPMNTPVSPEENNKLMDSLLSDIKQLKKGFIKIRGMYDRPEKSVAVINITPNELKYLADKYNQESYIFGQKQKQDDDKSTMEFSLIKDDDSIISSRDIILSNNELQSFNNFYSALKGRKFVIPFYDEKYEKKNIQPNQSTQSKSN